MDLIGLLLKKIFLDPVYSKVLRNKTPRLIAVELIEMIRTNEKMEARILEAIIILLEEIKVYI